MKNFFENIKSAFVAEDEIKDRADIVQTMIIIAIFALAAIAISTWITSAAMNKGADIAACIEGSNTYGTTSSTDYCKSQNHASSDSFKNDSEYKSRYGG